MSFRLKTYDFYSSIFGNIIGIHANYLNKYSIYKNGNRFYIITLCTSDCIIFNI